MTRFIALAIAVVWIAFPSIGQAQTVGLTQERVLVINQSSSKWPETTAQAALTFLPILLHFTPNVVQIDESKYTPGLISDFTKVVVIGIDAEVPLPERILRDLATTPKAIMWLGFGVEKLLNRSPGKYGFAVVDWHEPYEEETTLTYEGKTYPTEFAYYANVAMTGRQAHVWATIQRPKALVPIPYVISGANLWFVGTVPFKAADSPDPQLDPPYLVFVDMLHEFFQTGVEKGEQRAIVRLEDVSTHVSPVKMVEVVDVLRANRVPFAVGLIPNQRMPHGGLNPLRENPKLIKALRYAQDSGGTIILHGYYHTFGTGEDYEFWDDVHNRPLTGETEELYACKATDGIRKLRDFGLEPKMWETPHYAGSPMTYRVYGRYFSHAIENRQGDKWHPFPYGPDEYGQIVIPENLGYIHPFLGYTVEKQLMHARILRIVRDAWALGFYHPSAIPSKDLDAMVEGLKALGYTFVDLRRVPTEVRFDYRPQHAVWTDIWLRVNQWINIEKFRGLIDTGWSAVAHVFGHVPQVSLTAANDDPCRPLNHTVIPTALTNDPPVMAKTR